MAEVKPRIKLVSYTQNPENVVAQMARICYADNEEIKGIFDGHIDKVDDARMIRNLARMGHLSPFEHVSWSYEIEGVSRAMTHQLVRHRMASYSQRSQRYVGQSDFDFIVPPAIARAGLTERYHEMMKTIGDFYEELSKGLEANLGLTGEERNQDARYVLPNACETKIGVSFNAREFLHVSHERLCNRAQWEIREVVREMLILAYPTAPNIFSFAGPECSISGKCNQGKKSCGKIQEVKAYFETLKIEHKR